MRVIFYLVTFGEKIMARSGNPSAKVEKLKDEVQKLKLKTEQLKQSLAAEKDALKQKIMTIKADSKEQIAKAEEKGMAKGMREGLKDQKAREKVIMGAMTNFNNEVAIKPKKAAPKKAVSKKTSPAKASPKKAAAPKAAAKKSNTKKVAVKKAGPKAKVVVKKMPKAKVVKKAPKLSAPSNVDVVAKSVDAPSDMSAKA